MLYDPKWETKVPEPSLKGLVSWLETQPRGGVYDWDCPCGKCLIGLYGNAIGIGMKWHDFHTQLFEQDLLHIASNEPHTFGAALKRARAAQKR